MAKKSAKKGGGTTRGRKSASLSKGQAKKESQIEQHIGSVEPIPDGRGRGSVLVRVSSYSGPLPPPHMLREYEDIHSGAAGEIITMAKAQQSSRSAHISHILWNDTYKIWASLIVVLAFIGGAVWLALNEGNQALAITLALSGVITTLLREFFRNRKKD